jgi:threonine dehydratase
MLVSPLISVEAIDKAAERLKGIIVRTPLMNNLSLSEKLGADVYLKREDLQQVRSYKIRGAYNLISSLVDAEKGSLRIHPIVCASAGNHAQGVAFTCNLLQVNGTIFMPETTPKQKVSKVKMFGKEWVDVRLVGDTYDDAYSASLIYQKENNATFVHPFDAEKVMEGQGTVGKEILEDLPNVDVVLVPVGGGGLASGLGSYIKAINPNVKLIGVEPEGAAGMKVSIDNGKRTRLEKIEKFVDGAAVQEVGEKTFESCQHVLDKIITVPEGKVCSTILSLYNEEAIVVEPAGALTVAALDLLKDELAGKKVVCVVSGSNNDIDRMQEIKERSLIYEGLKHYFIVRFPQRAGALREFVNDVLGPNDDITRFEYVKKSAREAGPAVVGVELKFAEDLDGLLDRMKEFNPGCQRINDDPALFQYFI